MIETPATLAQATVPATQPATDVPAVPARAADPPQARRQRSDWRGVAFAAPYLAHLGLFFGYPLAFAAVLIFNRWDVVTPMEWVGTGNVARLVQDDLFAQAMLKHGRVSGAPHPVADRGRAAVRGAAEREAPGPRLLSGPSTFCPSSCRAWS